MANEWVKCELDGDDGEMVSLTCSDSITASKGTLVNLTDPRSTTGIAASGAMIGGVVARDKAAGDGATRVAVWTRGDFIASASGAFLTGVSLRAAGQNTVAEAGALEASGAATLGYSLYDASAKEAGPVRLRLT